MPNTDLSPRGACSTPVSCTERATGGATAGSCVKGRCWQGVRSCLPDGAAWHHQPSLAPPASRGAPSRHASHQAPCKVAACVAVGGRCRQQLPQRRIARVDDNVGGCCLGSEGRQQLVSVVGGSASAGHAGSNRGRARGHRRHAVAQSCCGSGWGRLHGAASGGVAAAGAGIAAAAAAAGLGASRRHGRGHEGLVAQAGRG